MKTKILILFIAIAPVMTRAQFTFTTNSGAITITGYNTAGGLNVVIPDSTNGYPVTAIGTNAFFQLTITSVTIGTNVTSIGVDAFYFCSDMTNVTIPSSVTSIGDGAFWGCDGLASVTIPDSVTNIGDDAFEACSSLTSVTIPNSVTDIGAAAFSYSGLTSVTIPNSVTSIGVGEFEDCFDLTSVTIPSSVTSIGDDAFADCGLTSVTIPNSATSISEYAFGDCPRLYQAYFQGNAPLVDGAAGSADSTVFAGETGRAYYLPGATGWGSTFGGWPTALWYQPAPLILGVASGLGVQGNQFGFTISWATNLSVVVQAATNLANPIWVPVATNTLVNGTNAFTDPTWTNYPQRFYRVQSN